MVCRRGCEVCIQVSQRRPGSETNIEAPYAECAPRRERSQRKENNATRKENMIIKFRMRYSQENHSRSCFSYQLPPLTSPAIATTRKLRYPAGPVRARKHMKRDEEIRESGRSKIRSWAQQLRSMAPLPLPRVQLPSQPPWVPLRLVRPRPRRYPMRSRG